MSAGRRSADRGRPRQTGVLYVVGVPIGHPDDMTLRALRLLKGVSVIASEDPRATHALLTHHRIETPVTTYHPDNRDEKTALLIDRLLAGQAVALVSDAGTPAVYDPGAFLVRRALELEIAVMSVPGPSAVTAALSVSGMDADRFTFVGRLPRNLRARQTLLTRLSTMGHTVVLFVEGSRLAATLRELRACLGNRALSISMNLTRADERVIRTTLETCFNHALEWRGREAVTLVLKARRAATGR